MFTIATSLLVVTFDQPLAPDTLDITNWFMRADNEAFPVTSAISAGSIVTLVGGIGSADVGDDVVTYTPPPFDVIGMNALEAIAFADFPITLV